MAAIPTPLPNSTLSSVQLDVIASLAVGKSIVETAQDGDIHRATIHNWLKLPEFRAQLEQAQRDYESYMHAKLGEIAELAVDTIRQILTDPKAPSSVKLRAALAVLDRPFFPKPKNVVSQDAEAPQPLTKQEHSPARNAACPCGSGNKYKRCCGTNAPRQLSRAA